jgi:hypothetical protein
MLLAGNNIFLTTLTRMPADGEITILANGNGLIKLTIERWKSSSTSVAYTSCR